MRGEDDVGDPRAVEDRGQQSTEGVPSAEAVAGGGDAGDFEFGADVGRGLCDDGVCGEWLVENEEIGYVLPWDWAVSVIGRWRAVEEVWDHGHWMGLVSDAGREGRGKQGQ